MADPADQPAWMPCDCGDFWCTIHRDHAWACPCPPIDDWDANPYVQGGAPGHAEEKRDPHDFPG